MTRRPLGWLVLLALPAMAAFACGSETKAKEERLCTPGNYVFCRCKDRSEGTKLCSEDGLAFGPCEACLGGTDNKPGDPEPEPTAPPPPPPPRDAGPPADAMPPVDSGPTQAPRPKVGELFITEVMYDPSGPEPSEEWFELFSIATQTVSLNGLVIRDGAGRVHTVPQAPPVLLSPAAHKVFVRNRAQAIATGVPAAAILFEYGVGNPDTGGVLLSNTSGGGVSLLEGTAEIVRVGYGAFAFSQSPPGGASIQLKLPDVNLAKNASGWCLSTTIWGGQPVTKIPHDKGSPGAASTCQ